MQTYGFSVTVSGDAIVKMQQIAAQSEKMSAMATTATSKVESSFSAMGQKIGNTLSNFRGLLTAGAGAGLAFGAFSFIKDSKQMYDDLEKSVVRVRQVISSTHGVAGFSETAIRGQAESMNKAVLFGKAQILDAQGMMLSFTGVRGPIFKQSMDAVADFAQFYKEDMTSAALQIGKALNNPLIGMTRLQRQGVEFSNQQKQQIKNYMEQGKLADAQLVIVKELNREFGGQAFAATLTDEGKIAMAAKKWEDFKEQIGKVVEKIELDLIPVFDAAMSDIKAVFNSTPVQFFIGHIKDLISILGKIIPMWIIYKTTMGAISLGTAVYTGLQKALGVAMTETAVAADGAAVATSGFSAAIASTGVGVFAVALGYIVSDLISYNSQLDDASEKITHLKEITNDTSNMDEKQADIQFQGKNVARMTGLQKGMYLENVLTNSQDASDLMAKTALKIDQATSKLNEEKKSSADYDKKHTSFWNVASLGISKFFKDQISINQKNIDGLHVQLKRQAGDKQSFSAIASWLQNHGVVLPKGSSLQSDFSPTDHTGGIENMSGAKGGLGEAKTITIKIDTLQKVTVEDGRGLKKASDDAVQILIRALQDLAYSQASTM